MRLKSSIPVCLAVLTLSGCNLTIPNGLLQSLTAAQNGKAGTDKGQATNDAKDKQAPPNGDRPAEGQPANGMMPANQMAPMAPVDPKTVFLRFDADNSGSWNLDEFRRFAMCPMPGGNPPPMPPQPGTQPPPPNGENQSGTNTRTGTTVNANVSTGILGVLQVQSGATVGATGSATVMPAQPPQNGTVGSPPQPMPPVCDPSKADGAFKEFDRDGNGQLNTDEAFVAIQKRMPMPFPQPQPTDGPKGGTCDEQFAQYDANRDKRVTWDEFFRPGPDMDPAAKDRYNEKFQTLDVNHDGALDPSEYCGTTTPPQPQPDPMPAPDCEARVKAYDPDADGKISFNDYADARYAEIRFVKAPTDEEVRKMKEGFLVDAKKLDTNGDGVLDYAELSLNCK